MKLKNGRTTGFLGKDKIYIGRANIQWNIPQSPLANPYVIGKDGNREEVIAKYRKWLWFHIKQWHQTGKLNAPVSELLRLVCDRSESMTLTCWCHPLPCHGDVIISCIQWMRKSN